LEEPVSHIETAEQKISLERLKSGGLVLDIGGGGEGLVSRIEGDRVCALDIRLSEIREAQIYEHSSNWLVADGRNLCFADESFDVVTLWFSLGYMSDWTIKQAVLQEAYRVLKRNGQLSMLATQIPETGANLILWATFTLPDGTLCKTGYGMRGGQDQTLPRVLDLITGVGFVQHQSEDHGQWFRILSHKL
jgi:ubiquinone/menaquinone biosynthesis C-methylase UbiE